MGEVTGMPDQDSSYIPELGQLCFGQPWQENACPESVVDVIESIASLWHVFKSDTSPFENTGASYEGEKFQAYAYDWAEEQTFNFAWRDVRISWYKNYTRGLSINREMPQEEVKEMCRDCILELCVDCVSHEGCTEMTSCSLTSPPDLLMSVDKAVYAVRCALDQMSEDGRLEWLSKFRDALFPNLVSLEEVKDVQGFELTNKDHVWTNARYRFLPWQILGSDDDIKKARKLFVNEVVNEGIDSFFAEIALPEDLKKEIDREKRKRERKNAERKQQSQQRKIKRAQKLLEEAGLQVSSRKAADKK